MKYVLEVITLTHRIDVQPFSLVKSAGERGVPLKRGGTDSDVNQSHDRQRLLPGGVRMLGQ